MPCRGLSLSRVLFLSEREEDFGGASFQIDFPDLAIPPESIHLDLPDRSVDGGGGINAAEVKRLSIRRKTVEDRPSTEFTTWLFFATGPRTNGGFFTNGPNTCSAGSLAIVPSVFIVIRSKLPAFSPVRQNVRRPGFEVGSKRAMCRFVSRNVVVSDGSVSRLNFGV